MNRERLLRLARQGDEDAIRELARYIVRKGWCQEWPCPVQCPGDKVARPRGVDIPFRLSDWPVCKEVWRSRPSF
jgi:hypothetical protein